MNTRLTSGGVALLGSMVVALPAAGQPASTAPSPWEDYDLVQFITTAGGDPASILRLDDNGSMALTAAGGINENELVRQTGAIESQLKLLLTWRLLERDGDTLRTSFPILDRTATEELRSWTRARASGLAAEIAPDVARLRDELQGQGRAANTYSILFSYVLDGLTWDQWEAAGVIPSRELSIEHPFWDGEIWALTPVRPNLVGTNQISDGRGAMVITWSYEALPSMKPFVSDLPSVKALFEAFADRRPTTPPEVRAVFEPYGLFNSGGALTIPIIEAGDDEPLYDVAVRIATMLVARVPDALDLTALRERFGFSSDAQALIIGYHELMWDVLALLESRGLVNRPAVLDGSDEPSQVAALIFGVR